MISAVMLWNEPNNLSHWDFEMDPEWTLFSEMIRRAAMRIRDRRPDLKLVLGGISPIDPQFIRLLTAHGALEYLDAVGVHGFPLDWNHWRIDEWPEKIEEIRRATPLEVWVTEVGASTFGAEEIQVFGIQKTRELLLGNVEHIFWYKPAGPAAGLGGDDPPQGKRGPVEQMGPVLDQNISGPMLPMSAYFMKHPPIQLPDTVACAQIEEFLMDLDARPCNKDAYVDTDRLVSCKE